ncbi:MAG: hypothetical protein K2L34_09680 [Muribaculaceae bacterium]|nr:hypothetical protein [Muribaculaceae bacterium]
MPLPFSLILKYSILPFIILILTGCSEQTSDSEYASNLSLVPLDSALNVLNVEMTKADDYRRQKEIRLNALKKDLRTDSGQINFKIANELFEEYKAYQSDSAFRYATIMSRIAEDANAPSLRAKANVAFADYFISVGFFKEASEMLGRTDSRFLNTEEKCNFYNLHTRLYRALCSYVGGESSPLWSTYNNLNRDYLDSILHTAPTDSYIYAYTKIDREQLDNKNDEKAIADRKALLSRYAISDHERAINYSRLAYSHLDAGKRKEAEYYLALSSIDDLHSNTTETTSATILANLLHEEGRNDEAYPYIQMALDDATFFNTRLRKYEISGYMPKIDQARYNWINGQIWKLAIVIAIILGLLILAVILFLQLKKRKRVLEQTNAELDNKTKEISKSHQQLAEANSLLNQTVEQLRETTEIKDRYIMQSLYVNTAFVNQVEEKCKEVVKAVKEKKYDDLKFLPYKMGIKEERQRIYRSFDEAFLKLFPNFIEELNKLFDAENQIMITDGELPMDVRIFALLRLGIADPADVAAYLNLSTKTVYVYKTKMKSRSNVGNNEFEDRVKAIPKP